MTLPESRYNKKVIIEKHDVNILAMKGETFVLLSKQAVNQNLPYTHHICQVSYWRGHAHVILSKGHASGLLFVSKMLLSVMGNIAPERIRMQLQVIALKEKQALLLRVRLV